MLAFLRSNLYPISVIQNPELRARLDAIRFGLVSSAVKMRANVNTDQPPLNDIERDPIVLSEIILKELKFCNHTINFITSVALNYREAAFDNTDRYISTDLEAQEAEDEADEADEEDQPVTMTSEQAHSTRISIDAYKISCDFTALCASLGIVYPMVNALSNDGPEDPGLFGAIHAKIEGSGDAEVEQYFVSICNISRASWDMMSVMAFANLYRYHYEFYATYSSAKPPMPANPDDAIFAGAGGTCVPPLTPSDGGHASATQCLRPPLL
jgi:hypothetical protein